MTRNLQQFFFIFAAILLLRSSLHAQDYGKDMQKISDNYSTKNIHFHLKYVFYPYDSIAVATDSIEAYCVMDGKKFYYKMRSGGNEFVYIKNNNYYVVVDYLQKAIALKQSSQAAVPSWNVAQVDSLMHSPTANLTYKDLGNQEGEYDIQLKQGTWNKLSIVFDKSSYTLTKVIMRSSAKGKLVGQKYDKPVIVISYYEYGKQTDNSCFNVSTYFSSTENPVVLSAAYKRYKLLDYIHNSSN